MNEFNNSYNLASQYENKNEIFKSLIEYRKALFYCQDKLIEEKIEDKIYSLEYKEYDLETIKIIKKYNKQVEKFAFDQISNPTVDIKVNDYIKIKKPKVKENLKVLFGTMEIANQMNTYSKGLRKNSVEAFTLDYYNTLLNHDTADFKLNYDYDKNIKKKISKLISQFDIFHFFFGLTLEKGFNDLIVLKKLGKKVFMNYWGSEIRQYSIASKICKYARVKFKNEAFIRYRIKLCSKYIDNCIVGDKELYKYIEGYYKNVYFISSAVDLTKYTNNNVEKNNNNFLIVHAPTHRECKGTKYIISAIDNLKEKYDFSFQLVEKMPHEKAKEIYKKADLIIDQILIGTYGLFSIECMCMGKPVICCISEYMKDKYPEDLPIISANPNDIEEKIEDILKNKEKISRLGEQGIKYVQEYHHIDKISKDLIDIYNK